MILRRLKHEKEDRKQSRHKSQVMFMDPAHRLVLSNTGGSHDLPPLAKSSLSLPSGVSRLGQEIILESFNVVFWL